MRILRGISRNFTPFFQKLFKTFCPHHLHCKILLCSSFSTRIAATSFTINLASLQPKEMLLAMMLLAIKSPHIPHSTYKFAKVLIRCWTVEIMPPVFLNNFSGFSQACHFVHQNMGHSVRTSGVQLLLLPANRPE